MTSTTTTSPRPTTLEPSERAELLTAQDHSIHLIKTDSLGRIRVTDEHRQALLDKFQHSNMSGQAFARHHGIKYTTFADWRQKQRKQLACSTSAKSAQTSEALISSLIEVTSSVTSPKSPNGSQEAHQDGLQIQLRDNLKMTLTNSSDVALAAQLIRQLQD